MAPPDQELIGIPFPNHSSEVLCGLNQQRRDGVLCDVLLVVREQEFHTHRSVLAACSHYFKKLFTVACAAPDSAPHAVYQLDFVAPEPLTAILEFAYTSTLTLTASNVKEILSAARLLEIPCVVKVCLEIMEAAEGEGEEFEGDDEDEEDATENDSKDGDPAGGRDDDAADVEEAEPSGSRHQDTPPEAKPREGVEGRALKDFSIKALLQEPSLERTSSFSPLLPGFYPPLWAADFPGYPALLEPRPFPTPPLESGPLDLALKKDAIKEELREEPANPLFLKDYVTSDPAKEGGDLRSYLSFLSASHLFPAWQLEEERKMKPKASQQCPICNKVIQGAGKLPRHMRTHTGEKPYMCSICEVRFTRQDKLKIHMRKHTGERPYICLHCNSKFVHNYDLKNHLRIHTGVRPYQCPHCCKSFTRSDHLHRHIKRQSCRLSRPRRGRKPSGWRSANFLFPADPGEMGGKAEQVEVGAASQADRKRGVFAFAVASEDPPFYRTTSDPWAVRLDRAPPITEAAK